MNRLKQIQMSKFPYKAELFALVVSVCNFWTLKILYINPLLALALCLESILLFLYLAVKKTKAISFAYWLIFILLSLYLLIFHFDKNIFQISSMQSDLAAARQNYLAVELGKLYQNRFGIFYSHKLQYYMDKISEKLFSYSDIGYYFSLENDKYFLPFILIFIPGLIHFLAGKISKFLLVNLLASLLICSFITLNDSAGPVLLFPFINLCIAVGLLKLRKMYIHKKYIWQKV